MASTGTIRKIAFGAAAEQAMPSVPALGVDIDWSALSATWPYILGKIGDDGDMGDLDEDDIEITPREESLVIDPPLSQAPESDIMFKNCIEMFNFSTYTYNTDVLALSSTATEAAGVVEEGVVVTYRAAIIEITGIAIHYFPKCRVKISGIPAGIKKLAKINFECLPRKTATVPSGHKVKLFGS